MDDLEFRRRAYAEPDAQDDEFVEHKNSSDENSHFVDELQQLDDKLKVAMQVEPPSDLAERIKLNQALEHHQTNRKQWRYISLAASVLVVFLITFSYRPAVDLPIDQQLGEDVLQHIYHELNHLDDKQDKSLAQLNQVLSGFNANMRDKPGTINYLGSCDIAKVKGVHMVVQGDVGPVTVMMLPGVSLQKESAIKDSRFHGILLSTPRGTMAVVGEQGESIQEIKKRLSQKLVWI